MTDKKSEEYVVIHGKKYFIHSNKLDLTDVYCSLSEIEGLSDIYNLEVLLLQNNNIHKIENLEATIP